MQSAAPTDTIDGGAHPRREEVALVSKATERPAGKSDAIAAAKVVCLVGLGYVGLPMAALLASRGFRVTGVDTNPAVREALTAGTATGEAGVDELLRAALGAERLSVAATPPLADVFIIAVPTPLAEGNEADLSAVRAAARSLAPVLRPGNLVVLESTVPPGTTERLLVPQLERSGRRAGRDLLVAHVPERVLPGNALAELRHNARVIGGIDQASAEAAHDVYASFVEGEIHLTDARTAEMVKLMENTYRDVNIALANEFALLAQDLGVDIRRAIELANHHPRVEVLQPGPGVGGHCIPVDPWFLAAASAEPAPLIRAARAVNDAMPERVAAMLREAVAGIERPVVALLGLSYKAGADDTRNSPAIAIAKRLRSWGHELRLHDPLVVELPGWQATCPTPLEAATGADCLALLTDHPEFAALDPTALRGVMRRPLVFDTRGLVDAAAWRAADFEVRQLGAPLAPSS